VIVLYPNEQILYQKEARLKLSVKLSKEKVEGKGIFYITNIRIVFEDYRQGILTQFAYHDIHGYRKVKGLLGSEKLSVDFKRSDIKTDYQGTLLAEFEFKGVDDAYKLLSMLTSNSSTSNNTVIGYINVQNNHYNMMNTNKNTNYPDDMPEQYKPWIADIKFTWNPATRWKELGLKPIGGDEEERPWSYFEYYVDKIADELNKIGNNLPRAKQFSNDFKYKIAREAYKLRADLPYEEDFTYDSNKYWVGVIQHAYKDGSDELVGININADSGSSFFIYCPEHWYHWFLLVVDFGYDYKRDKPSWIFDDDDSERQRIFRLTLSQICKEYYLAILNKDFKKAEESWKEMSETYKKYETEEVWLGRTGMAGLVLKYAVEMDKRNIPFPSEVKRSPI
jgi:hypothetical protein